MLIKKILNILNRRYRNLTARYRALPDFIIVGAQKAGTTSLYAYMSKHPDITPAFKKEVHFFDDRRYKRGLTFYRRHFPLKHKPYGLTGEASPYYMVHPHAMRRIAEDIPGVKLIVMLRNPVDRAYSGYHHAVKNGLETRDLRTAFRDEAAMMEEEVPKMMDDVFYNSRKHQFCTYVHRGYYAEQLKAIYELFPKEDVFVVESDDFFTNTSVATNRVFEFLGLHPHELSNYPIKNVGRKREAIPDDLHQELHAHFAPYNEELYRMIGQDFNWSPD